MHMSPRVAVSNTGPLISALQSDCMHILLQFYDQIHIPVDEISEYQKHGAGHEIGDLIETGFLVIYRDFTPLETDNAMAIAAEIANHKVLKALEECQRQGTHYSPKLINEIYNNLMRL